MLSKRQLNFMRFAAEGPVSVVDLNLLGGSAMKIGRMEWGRLKTRRLNHTEAAELVSEGYFTGWWMDANTITDKGRKALSQN